LNLASIIAPIPSPSETHIDPGPSFILLANPASHSYPGIKVDAAQEANPSPLGSEHMISSPPHEI